MMKDSSNRLIEFIRGLYPNDDFVPLHAPRFYGNERKYIMDAIDSTFVSSVGSYVNRVEQMMQDITGAKYAVASVNGTSALHISLLLAGVQTGDEVFTQPLTFVATCNAIAYCNAKPVFIDVDRDTMGLSPGKLKSFLESSAEIRNGQCFNRVTGNRIAACVPMHTFGHPCRIDELFDVCTQYNIALVEDAAESLGSYYKGQHTGTFGLLGILSFNGNKIATAGGGGVIITSDTELGKKAKYLTTTAKVPHPYEFVHNEIGYNYRMPNLNAALICAQLEQLDAYLANKRETAERYKEFFANIADMDFVVEPENSRSNYWLNTVLADSLEERDRLLKVTNDHGVMTRPVWKLMNKLEMFKDCQCGDLTNAEWLESRVVNLPSSVRI
jgi:perosamine synthetase